MSMKSNRELCEEIIFEARRLHEAVGRKTIPLTCNNPYSSHRYDGSWRKKHPDLINLTEAAEILGVSKLALARYIRHDMIEAITHNGAHYVRRDDVHNFQPV